MKVESIRTLTMRAKTEGFPEATAEAKKLAGGMDNVAKSATGMAVATDTASKRQMSGANAYKAQSMRLDETFRMQEKLNRETKIADTMLRQGGINEQQHAERIALITSHYTTAATATDKFTKQTGLARHELVNLGRQAQDVAVSLGSGQGIGTVLLQQGMQVADIFATTGGTLRGFASQAAAGFMSLLTPVRAVIGGVAAIGTTAVMAGTSFQESQANVTRALSGIGRASQLTATDIGQIATASSSVHALSRKEAEETASVFAATGKMYRDNITTATSLTHDFAKAVGVDTADAAKMLAEGLTTGIAGIDKLDQKYAFLTAAQREYLKDLDANVDKTQFQAAAIDMLSSKLVKASEVTTTWSQGWTVLGNVVSNVFRSIGELSTPAPTKDISAVMDKIKDVEEARERVGMIGGASATRDLQALNQELANLNLKLTELQGKQLEAKFGEIGKGAMSLVDAFTPLETKAKAVADALKLLEQVRGMPEVGLTMSPEQLKQLDRAIDAKRVDLMMTKEAAAEEARRNQVALELTKTYGTQSVEVAKVLDAQKDQTAVTEALAMLRRKQGDQVDNINLKPTNVINLKDKRNERRNIPSAA